MPLTTEIILSNLNQNISEKLSIGMGQFKTMDYLKYESPYNKHHTVKYHNLIGVANSEKEVF